MFFNTVNWNIIDIYWKKLSIAHHIAGEIHFLCLLWDEHVNLIKCCPKDGTKQAGGETASVKDSWKLNLRSKAVGFRNDRE